MKKVTIITALLITSLNFATVEPTRDTPRTARTLFGTEMNINDLVYLTYENVSFYVAKKSGIAKLHREDKVQFDILMNLTLDNYKDEYKHFNN